MALWDKQVDNLRTNHRVRVLFSLIFFQKISLFFRFFFFFLFREYTFCKITSSSPSPASPRGMAALTRLST
jgi:hypothetical protein